MERHFVIFIFALFGAILLSSCGAVGPYFHVVKGNYALQNGRYQEAVVSYSEAMKADLHSKWIYYNLGNAYRAQGEADAAFNMWQRAVPSDSSELGYHVHFNMGTVHYEQGKYREAYQEFKKALQLKPSGTDAKINLEMCLKKMEADKENKTSKPKSMQEAAAGKGQQNIQRLLDYVRRKEIRGWNTEKSQEQETVKDW